MKTKPLPNILLDYEKHYTFTMFETPEKIIRQQNMITGPFYMTLRGEDLDLFCEVVHYVGYHDKAMRNEPWENDDLVNMLNFLSASENERAWSIRTDILSTLNIEEI